MCVLSPPIPCPRWHPKHLEDMSGARVILDRQWVRFRSADNSMDHARFNPESPSLLSGIKRFYGDVYKYRGCCKFREQPKAEESWKGSQTTGFGCTSLKGSDCFACVFSTQQYGGERGMSARRIICPRSKEMVGNKLSFIPILPCLSRIPSPALKNYRTRLQS